MNEQIPSNFWREPFLGRERDPFAEWVSAQRELRDRHLDIGKPREQFLGFAPTEGVCDWAFRAVGAVMDKIAPAQVRATLRKKISVVNLPNVWVFIYRVIQFIVAGTRDSNEWDARHGYPVEPLMDAGQIREWLAAGHDIGRTVSPIQTGRGSAPRRRASRFSRATNCSKTPLSASRAITATGMGAGTRSCATSSSRPATRRPDTTDFAVNTPDAPRHALHRIFPFSAGKIIYGS